MSAKNKRATDGSLPLENPSLVGYNMDTEIDAILGESFVKTKNKRKVNPEVLPLLNPKRTTRQSSIEGVEVTAKPAVVVSGLPLGGSSSVLPKKTTGGTSKKKFVEESEMEVQKTMESNTSGTNELKKEMEDCMVGIDSLNTLRSWGEAMGRVVGSGKLANQVVAYKNIEKELSVENANLNTTLNRCKLDAKKAKEGTLAEAKKVLEKKKKEALALKVQGSEDAIFGTIRGGKRKEKYYKGLVKAGGPPCDDSSDDDIPQTPDVHGVMEVNEDQVTMDVDDPRPMEVADVQVPEGMDSKPHVFINEDSEGDGGKSTVIWDDMMDRILLDTLYEQLAKGGKSDNGWKSRLKTWRLHHNVVKKMKNISGFGWDEERKIVVADEALWKEVLKTRKHLKKFKGKPLSNYEEIAEILGNDQANGSHATTIQNTNVDMGEEHDQDYDPEIGNQPPQAESPFPEVVTSPNPSTSNIAPKRQRNRSSCELMSKQLKGLQECVSKVADAMMFKSRDQDALMEKVTEELEKLETLDLEAKGKAMEMFATNTGMARMFLAMKDDAKEVELSVYYKPECNGCSDDELVTAAATTTSFNYNLRFGKAIYRFFTNYQMLSDVIDTSYKPPYPKGYHNIPLKIEEGICQLMALNWLNEEKHRTSRVICWQWPQFNYNTIKDIKGISVGEDFVCGLSELGNIYCFGTDQNVIGDTPEGNYNIVASGVRHACAISLNGSKLDCWGDVVGREPLGLFKALALGEGRSCALRTNGTVVCWGVNDFYLPERLRETEFVTIKARRNVFCGVLVSNYSLFCWGNDVFDSNPMVFESVLPRACRTECPCKMLSGSGRFCEVGSICPPCKKSGTPGNMPLRAKDKKKLVFIVVGCIGSVSLVIVWVFLIVRCCKIKGCRIHDSGPLDDVPHQMPVLPKLEKRLSKLVSTGNLEDFCFKVVARVTENFSEEHKIGYGSFGSVYRAILDDGREVAIKRAELTGSSSYAMGTKRQDDKENAFLAELTHLSRVNHKNLVRLFGFCEEGDEHLLVYEFMSNGTLYDHLHKHDHEGSPLTMSWASRIRVALDAAKGIEYLHRYVIPSIIHRDIKSSNILLDGSWTAKVSDFGLSVIGPGIDMSHLSLRAAGTVGYMDPEYYRLQQLTTKSDVYSFGVVLLELLSGLKAIHPHESGIPRNVVDFVVPHIIADEIQHILDPKLAPPTPIEIEGVVYTGYVAADCVSPEGRDRPSMTEVVQCLERALDACEGIEPLPQLFSRSTTGSST
ncbi:hypothetical protein GIB67_020575 [Kingdonia uniflora]|uniref:Protein kinase domain-containing protein n=1 Tax=Kingdonia uniflora TaxID=39325 RepID=A0A7J7NV94_9MAGN|nr:hypothetical protein GIB67_020575 [Kingdonia uniflora]